MGSGGRSIVKLIEVSARTVSSHHRRATMAFALAAAVAAIALGIGDVEPQAQAPAEQCVFTQGYWRNHTALWPVDSLDLGQATNPRHAYGKSELIALLDTPVRGDASLILAHQLIAAKLNVANGANPAPVADALSRAAFLLGIFQGSRLPYRVVPNRCSISVAASCSTAARSASPPPTPIRRSMSAASAARGGSASRAPCLKGQAPHFSPALPSSR